ncbi:uncharacterized protein [Cherax quadricarinatus]|uniref:uncharacterized protein isoform X1 n=1 Tax=Cherax quadricarinatus TaxID=27406 RepID=UPI002379DFE1|nr:uncharacterized protein LOC128685800 isoform X1 [Cherax quadricarinatus]
MKVPGIQIVTVLLLLLISVRVHGKPQNLGIQVNNQALLTLGVGLLATGVGFHLGRQLAIREQNKYNNPNYIRYQQPFYGFRRRRQAHSENELEPLMEQLFQKVLQEDVARCSLQLTCVVGSIPPSSLMGYAKNLYIILSSLVPGRTVDTTKEWSGLKAFQVALKKGRDGGDCHQLFPHCQTSSTQLLQQFQNTKIVHGV